MIDKVAPTNSRVMITGPAGSGKEVVARLLHDRSARAPGAFIVVNSAAIAAEKMEQELFGVEQNGKVVKTGLFEQAHGGTLLLDEVSDMPKDTQAKILRVLTDQTFQRVGGNKMVQVDVRVISATSQDLVKAIEAGAFREDLYHRLNVVPLKVPALSERREDIPALVAQFLEILSESAGHPRLEVDADAMAALQGHDWPGNVRQLRNVIERVLIMAHGEEGEQITLGRLPSELSRRTTEFAGTSGKGIVMSVPLRQAREAFEREYLKIQITRFSGNISRTATFIGMERSALHRKLKSLGITTNGRGRQVVD
jgi:two-component system nitrogen regulation response regulator NtrX